MPPDMCFEILIATVLLWVCVFGLADITVSHFSTDRERVLFYLGVGFAVLVFILTHPGVNVCSLM